jgi:hypothetical protein
MQPSLPWIALVAALVLAAVGLMVWALRPRRTLPTPLPTEWSLGPRPVFSTDERRVYRQLREALPHYIVLSKLPLVRFCQPTDPQEVRYWYELLGSLHVTFAICSANGRVLAAIDLDNDRQSTPRALQIKQSVLGACRVRYLRCSPDQMPSIPELQLLVPQTAGAARGPQSASVGRMDWRDSRDPRDPRDVRDALASAVAARRRERGTLWQDSGFFQDSFFGIDNLREAGPASSFGALRGDSTFGRLNPPASPTAHPPAESGDIVIEAGRRPTTRH